MEANSYEQMVKEELQKRKETSGTSTPTPLVSSETTGSTHLFKQTFYIQETFENRKFLGFSYTKKVGQVAIPVGLCEICNQLEVEHENIC